MEKPSDDSQWIDGTVLEIPSKKCPVVLDPLTRINFRMFVGDVRNLTPSLISDGLFNFHSRFVLYVDIIGVVRQIDARQNYYLAQVDDGTGQVFCTIWRRHIACSMPDLRHGNNQLENGLDLGQKLVQLAIHATPVTLTNCVSNFRPSSSLAIGDTVHLRGRLRLFREAITISANYCRIIMNPQEILDSVLQAHHLKTHVYSKPYSPAQILGYLKGDLQKSSNGGLLQRIQRAIEADRLFHFTALDLQLHAQVVHELRVSSEFVADELCCEPDWETVPPQISTCEATTSRSLESSELKGRVQAIIDQFLKEGIVYRSTDPIGGMYAYHYTLRDRRMAKSVCQIISVEQKDYERGIPFNNILEKLRSFTPIGRSQRPYRSVTRSALAKLINCLLERSQIYIVNPDCYKIA